MSNYKLSTTFAVALLLGFSTFQAGASADTKAANVDALAALAPDAIAVENFATATSLVRYGDANNDPLALITAAKMMKDIGQSDSRAEVVDASSAEDKVDIYSVASILERARAMATNRPDLLAMADDVDQHTGRGAMDGPGRKTTVVSRHSTDVYRVKFKAGETALVIVSGDGDSDLDLFVYDENDREVCRDDDLTDQMLCAWTPRWSGEFTIKVKNLGVANLYTIIHN